jgi:hypothetical protein
MNSQSSAKCATYPVFAYHPPGRNTAVSSAKTPVRARPRLPAIVVTPHAPTLLGSTFYDSSFATARWLSSLHPSAKPKKQA